MDDNWIVKTGNKCPVPEGVRYQMKMSDGEIVDDGYQDWDWHDWSTFKHENPPRHIVAWRVVETPSPTIKVIVPPQYLATVMKLLGKNFVVQGTPTFAPGGYFIYELASVDEKDEHPEHRR